MRELQTLCGCAARYARTPYLRIGLRFLRISIGKTKRAMYGLEASVMTVVDIQSLRRVMECAAQYGTKMLRDEWNRLTPKEKLAMKPYTDALKMQAEKVDKETL